MATSAGAVELSKVDDTQQFPLGLEHTVEPVMAGAASADLNRGVQVWVYVKASALFAQGSVVARNSATTTYDGILGTAVPAIRILGVAQHAIASGKYGWILKRGLGEIKVSDTGTDGQDAALVTAGSAGVDVLAAGEEHQVIALGTENAGGVAGNLITAYINCPG